MYDDYMQNLLGGNYYPYQNTYEPMVRNTGCCNHMNEYNQYGYSDYEPNFPYMSNQNITYGQMPYNYIPNYLQRNLATDLEDLYPEIYKIIYPMIQKICSQNTRPIDEDLLEEMTNTIYSNIEANNVINLNINVDNSTSENNRSETSSKPAVNNRSVSNVQNSAEKEKHKENRPFNNSSLRDLIRILLIRELLGRPGNRPPRPRPPIPPRPPIRPRF